MTDDQKLLTMIGKLNSKLTDKLYTKKEVKEITLQIAKEMEHESNNNIHERI
jgi:hypothetical protein